MSQEAQSDKGHFPPQPTVEHLLTIFRRIDAGGIVIPAFQRAFVWEKPDVIELLRSVVNGYPVGSLLMWTSEEDILRPSESPDVPFPSSATKLPVNYVLDGLQRLSSLYGVFHFGTATHNPKFDVLYDLRSGTFVHRDDPKAAIEAAVPLSSLFQPRKLLSVQQNLLDFPDADLLIDRLLWLQGRFQEYMIPIVTIKNRDVKDVVVMFERVNSTGVKLSRVDFIRAITWKSEYDLASSMKALQEICQKEAFELDDDTIVKCIAWQLGIDPEANSLLQLRNKSPSELMSATSAAAESLQKTIMFFRTRMSVTNSVFVPYEGQILSVFAHVKALGDLSPEVENRLYSWIAITSFGEILQGRPENYIARLLRSAGGMDFFEDVPIWLERGILQPVAYRRLLRGKALTSSFTMMLIHNGARSLIDGRILDPAVYTHDFAIGDYAPIIPIDDVKVKLKEKSAYARILGNVVLSPGAEGTMLARMPLEATIAQIDKLTDRKSVLKSQLLTEDCIDALRRGEFESFLEMRSEEVKGTMRRIASVGFPEYDRTGTAP